MIDTMALLLNIDTATEQASVCLSKDDSTLAIAHSEEQKNHASFIQPAIEQLIEQSGYSLSALDAIAVTAGPGSYTGLRVGLSTAKGLCYALGKPLIMINTLEVMALAAIETHLQHYGDRAEALFCPMIDARRMEVFTAVYNQQLEIQQEPAAMILNENSFYDFINNHFIVFSGSGSHKFRPLIPNPEAVLFLDVRHSASHLAKRAFRAFQQALFSDLAYSEPFYLKEFFSIAPRA